MQVIPRNFYIFCKSFQGSIGSSNKNVKEFTLFDLTKKVLVRVYVSFFQTLEFLRITVWKNDEFTLTAKKFRQINYLVISLVKPLLSQNFFQKCVRVISRNFHTVRFTLNLNQRSMKSNFVST